MPDDHSDLEPLLPIPNRTVKQVSADDSAGSRVKVGHRQALIAKQPPVPKDWGFCFCAAAVAEELGIVGRFMAKSVLCAAAAAIGMSGFRSFGGRWVI